MEVALSRTPYIALRAIGLMAVGGLLAWLVASKTLVAVVAGSAPEAALWLNPGDAQALLSLAGQRRKASSGSQPPADIRALAGRALAGDPVNARALRLLGEAAEAAGDRDRAAAFMQAAAQRSVQESAALHWLLESHYRRKEYAEALRVADALLRTRTRALPRVLPFLSRMAETPEALPHLERLLAANPPWRRRFLLALPRAVADARTPLRLLLAVRDAPDPPALADIRGYLDLLMRHKFYELAYYTWLQFLPRGQLGRAGFVFNGSFELVPSELPFDWTVGGGRGAAVEIARRPPDRGSQPASGKLTGKPPGETRGRPAAGAHDRAGERALLITLGPGRVRLRGPRQTLLLAPGTYRLHARHRGQIAGPRGLRWHVACLAGGPLIGQGPMLLGETPAWTETAFSFTVPAEGCRAQRLELVQAARMPSERLVSGSLWLDEVRIVRGEQGGPMAARQ